MADHSSIDEKVVAIASEWKGTPYVHQQSVKGAGCDCLGLLIGVFREVHGRLPEKPPPYTREWAESSREEVLLGAATRNLKTLALRGPYHAGSILIFRMRRNAPAKHCGIVSGKDTFIHSLEGHGVIESPLSEGWTRLVAGHFSMDIG